MRTWIAAISVLVVAVVAALLVPWWLPPLLAFVGARSEEIQGLESLVQLVVLAVAGLVAFLGIRRRRKNGPSVGRDYVARDRITNIYQQQTPTVDALHQLPQPPRNFTGRGRDIAEFMAELEKRGAVISCRGMGGVGKTALALVLAQRLTDRYPDAQIFLNLRGVPQQESVTKQEPVTTAEAMAHVIRAFHPDFKPPDDRNQLQAQYHSVLEGRRVLLLMDNAADRPQVEPLVPPPTCLMLVTTRQRFTLPGLFWKDLDALPPGEARALVLRIAPRIGEAADEMAEVCGRLPLALVTAASALAERPDLDPAGHLARLREATKRLKLVDASLSLSYDLLDAGTGRRFAALAVFAGGFDARGAAAVWDIPPDEAREVLGELVRYSLVQYEAAAGRYHLHDLVRVFADSRLAKGERAGAEKRHAAQYKAVLAQADDLFLKGGQAVLSGLALFDAEWENIRAGQAWAADHAAKDPAAAALCNAYPDAGVYCLSLRLHPREWIRWLEAALAAARKVNDRAGEGVHLGNLGLAYADLGEVRRAIELYEQQLEITREIGDRRGEGNALGNLGSAYARLGEARRAIEFYEQALAIAHEIGDRRGEEANLGNLGLSYAALSEVRRAIEFYEQALAIAREIGDRRGEGQALGNLGNAYARLGEVRRAIEFYEQALAIDREIGDKRGEGIFLWNMALAYEKMGDRREAVSLAAASLEIYEAIEDPNAEKVRRTLQEWRGGG